jgi:hypothetical protein
MSAAMSKYRYLAHLTEIATESAQVSGTEKTSVVFPPGFYRFGDDVISTHTHERRGGAMSEADSPWGIWFMA